MPEMLMPVLLSMPQRRSQDCAQELGSTKQMSGMLQLTCIPSAGLGLHLDSVQKRHPDQLAQGPTFIGNNIVHPTAKIGNDCQIGPDVSIGLECVIGDGVRISNSVLLHRVKVSHVSILMTR